MSSSEAPTPSTHPSGVPVGEIDASFRLTALTLFGKAAVWLVVGSLLLLIASVKLHAPGMMAGKAWLTYGRLQPAGWNALVYGFGGQAGAALALWLVARAAGQRLRSGLLVFGGGCFWNLGVLFGVLGILTGESTGREWLEMPAGAMACLVVGAGLIGAVGWMTFAGRTQADAYPSAWFALLALLAFVWCGSVALLMLSGGAEAPHGVIQVLVQRWYAGGVLRLWIGGITVAAILHLLPEVMGRPLASRQLAWLGFWALVFFAPWAVTAHGDPFPRWLVSAGLAGQYLATISLLALALNFWKTIEGSAAELWSTTKGRLVGAAAAAYVLAGVLAFVTSLSSVASVTRLTWMASGIEWLQVGALILVVAAALPEILWRATGQGLSPGLVSAHAWLTLIGVGLTALSMVFGGWIQGGRLGDGSTSFVDALRASLQLVRLSTLGITALFLGQVVLLGAVGDLVRRLATEVWQTGSKWASSTPSTVGRAAGVRS